MIDNVTRCDAECRCCEESGCEGSPLEELAGTGWGLVWRGTKAVITAAVTMVVGFLAITGAWALVWFYALR